MKGKSRHNPNKPANRQSKWCQLAEWIPDGKGVEKLLPYVLCHYKTDKCQGLAHNCVKALYKKEQIKRSEP